MSRKSKRPKGGNNPKNRPKKPEAKSETGGAELPRTSFWQWALMIGALVAILAGITETTTGVFGIYDRVIHIFESPLPTPRPFSEESPGESLIVVAPFDRADGIPDSRPHAKIADAIQSVIDELKLENVRVETLSEVIPSRSVNKAEEIGSSHGATTIIWGEETSVDIRVNLLNRRTMLSVFGVGFGENSNEFYTGVQYVQPEKAEFTGIGIPGYPHQNMGSSPLLIPPEDVAVSLDIGTYVTTNTDPQDYIQLITRELPDQITFLALLPISQVQLFSGNEQAALESLEKALSLRRNELLNDDIGEVFRATARLHLILARQLRYAGEGGTQSQLLEHGKTAKLRLNQALEAGLDDAFTYYLLASANEFLNDFVEGVRYLDTAIAKGPDDHLRAYILHNRAVYKLVLNDDQGALADITELLQLDPTIAGPYILRCGIRFREGDYLGTIADANMALEILGSAASIPDILDLKGRAYIALEQYDKAVEVYEDLVDVVRPEDRAYAGQRLQEARALQNP